MVFSQVCPGLGGGGGGWKLRDNTFSWSLNRFCNIVQSNCKDISVRVNHLVCHTAILSK